MATLPHSNTFTNNAVPSIQQENAFLSLTNLVPGTDSLFWKQLYDYLSPFVSKFIDQNNVEKKESFTLTFGLPQIQAMAILFHQFMDNNPFELKAQLKKKDIEYESKFESLHHKLEDMSQSSKTLTLENVKLQSECKSIKDELVRKENQVLDILRERTNLGEQLSECKSEIVSLQQEKRDLLKLQGHHSQLDSLQQEEYLKMTQKYTELRTELDMLRSDAAQSKVDVITIRYEKDRLEQQGKIAQQQLQWYEQQYQSSLTDHLQQQQLKNEKIHSLLHQLDQVTQEKTRLESSFQQIQTLHDQLAQSLQDKQEKIVDLETELQSQAVQFHHEIKLHQQVSEKHQSLAKEAHSYAESMAKHVAEAKAAYLQLQSQAQLNQTSLEEAISSLETKYTNLESKHKNLLQQLCGNDMDLALDMDKSSDAMQLFASSFATMKAQWSGKSYTELFETLIAKETKLTHLEARHTELKEALQSVFEELESRAPYYQQLVKENEDLRSEKKQAQRDWLGLEKQKVDLACQLTQAKENIKQVTKESEQLRRRCSYLASQLVHLLSGMNADQVIEHLTSTFLHNIPDPPSSTLSSFLVFDDVETLVNRNQELLERQSELELQLEKVTEKINGLDSQTQEQMDALIKEKEDLKKVCDSLKEELENVEKTSSSSSSSSMPTSNSTALTNNERLHHLESVVTTLETKLRDTETALLNKEKQLVQLEGQCQFLSMEKKHTLSALNVVKEENQVLTTKSNTYVSSLSRWEEKHSHVLEELHQLQRAHEETKQQYMSIKLEKCILEKAQEQVLEQVSKTAVERDMYSRMFNETQLNLQQQVAQAQKETVSCRAQVQALEFKLVTLTNQLEDAHVQEKRLLAKHAKDIEALQKEWLEKLTAIQETRTAAAPSSVSPALNSNPVSVLGPNARGEGKEVMDGKDDAHDTAEKKEKEEEQHRLKLLQLEKDLEFATTELQQKEKRFQELMAYAKDIESQLQAFQKEKEAWMGQEIELQAEVANLKQSVSQFEQKCSEWETRHNLLQTTFTEQSEAYQVVKIAHEQCEMRWSELQMELTQASENYLREFQAHAKNVQLLETLKHQLNELRNQLQESHMAKDRMHQEKERAMKECEAQLQASEAKLKQMNDVLTNVREQNDQLYSQMTSDEGVQALIQLLRSERDALLLEKEVTVMASARQLAQQERTIKHLKELPSVAPEAIHLKEQLASIQQALERERNEVQLLRESNTTLRQERQHFEQVAQVRQGTLDTLESDVSKARCQAAELEAQVQALQAQVERYSKEAQEWRYKYTHLFQKYETIDPEQHSALQTQVQQLTIQVQEVQSQLEQSEQKYQDTVAKANANLSKFKESLLKSKDEVRNKTEAYNVLEQKTSQDLQLLQAQVQGLNAQLKESQEVIDVKEQDLKKLHDAFEKKKQEVGGLKNQLISFKMRIGTPPPPPPPPSLPPAPKVSPTLPVLTSAAVTPQAIANAETITDEQVQSSTPTCASSSLSTSTPPTASSVTTVSVPNLAQRNVNQVSVTPIATPVASLPPTSPAVPHPLPVTVHHPSSISVVPLSLPSAAVEKPTTMDSVTVSNTQTQAQEPPVSFTPPTLSSTHNNTTTAVVPSSGLGTKRSLDEVHGATRLPATTKTEGKRARNDSFEAAPQQLGTLVLRSPPLNPSILSPVQPLSTPPATHTETTTFVTASTQHAQVPLPLTSTVPAPSILLTNATPSATTTTTATTMTTSFVSVEGGSPAPREIVISNFPPAGIPLSVISKPPVEGVKPKEVEENRVEEKEDEVEEGQVSSLSVDMTTTSATMEVIFPSSSSISLPSFPPPPTPHPSQAPPPVLMPPPPPSTMLPPVPSPATSSTAFPHPAPLAPPMTLMGASPSSLQASTTTKPPPPTTTTSTPTTTTTTATGFEFKPIEFPPSTLSTSTTSSSTPANTPTHSSAAKPVSSLDTPQTPRSARLRQRGALPTVPTRRSGAGGASHMLKKP